MFDFRYHLASLTAVFLALVIGILVGVGLSGRGFVDDAERTRLENDVADVRDERDEARAALEAIRARESAMEDYAEVTYEPLVAGRLADRRVALVFAGSVDQAVRGAIDQAVRDAGGRVARVRALTAPLDVEAVETALRTAPALGAYAEPGRLDELGRDLARELVGGGRTPLLDALSDELVEEADGGAAAPVDAVVVARSARPQRGPTKDFLGGLYAGLARSGVPAVGVEALAAEFAAIPTFARAGLSTVDSINTDAGRLAAVLLLAGARPGQYGVLEPATSGVLPPIEPLRALPR